MNNSLVKFVLLQEPKITTKPVIFDFSLPNTGYGDFNRYYEYNIYNRQEDAKSEINEVWMTQWSAEAENELPKEEIKENATGKKIEKSDEFSDEFTDIRSDVDYEMADESPALSAYFDSTADDLVLETDEDFEVYVDNETEVEKSDVISDERDELANINSASFNSFEDFSDIVRNIESLNEAVNPEPKVSKSTKWWQDFKYDPKNHLDWNEVNVSYARYNVKRHRVPKIRRDYMEYDLSENFIGGSYNK